jgi:hypothetical protein
LECDTIARVAAAVIADATEYTFRKMQCAKKSQFV